MANTVTNVLPKLLAQGLMALRQNAVMSRLVNRSYDTLAAGKGAVINMVGPAINMIGTPIDMNAAALTVL